MKKVISFCLFGNQPKYCVGAVRNAKLARQIYKGWKTRFYCGESVPENIRIALLQTGACGFEETEYRTDVLRPYRKYQSCDELTELVCYADQGNHSMMLDRFLAIQDNDVAIFRDCDSRLSNREKLAVDQWLESDKSIHSMHCHFHHSVPILGGLWGIKNSLFAQEMCGWAMEWAKSHKAEWQCDQNFLKEVVWPLVSDTVMNHADFHMNIWPGIPFPTSIQPGHFIGATYDENDNIDQKQLRELYG